MDTIIKSNIGKLRSNINYNSIISFLEKEYERNVNNYIYTIPASEYLRGKVNGLKDTILLLKGN